MSMPSPFEIGRAVGTNVYGGYKQGRDLSQIDQILADVSSSGDPQLIDDAMSQIVSNVSPERQEVALALLKDRQNRIIKQKEIQAKQAKGSQSNAMNPEAQKWAYKELEKKGPIQALQTSLDELERLNESGVTGPVKGRAPSWLANTEEDAIRKAIDANAIQILNVHKSMFPRGLTQGEFNTLSKKLVSSSNTQLANQQIIQAYRRLAGLQQKKLDAVEQATRQFGFDPMLPFIVSGIQKEFEEEEARENRELYNQVVGGKKGFLEPSASPNKQKGAASSNAERQPLEEIFK